MLLEFSSFFSVKHAMCLRKVQQCYTNLYNYRDEFVLKPVSNASNIFVCCNQVSKGSYVSLSFKWIDNFQ